MGPRQAIAACLRRYATFSGRASRSEFWWFVGAVWVGSAIAAMIDAALSGPRAAGAQSPAMVSTLFSLATFLPGLAAGWRRMHDTGRMGIYIIYPVTIVIGIVFFAGILDSTGLMAGDPASGLSGAVFIAAAILFLLSPFIVLYWLIRPSQPGPNAYGPNPHEVTP